MWEGETDGRVGTEGSRVGGWCCIRGDNRRMETVTSESVVDTRGGFHLIGYLNQTIYSLNYRDISVVDMREELEMEESRAATCNATQHLGAR